MTDITTKLQTCLKPGRSLQIRHENMWKAYHGLRTTLAFLKSWEIFLQQFAVKTEPSFYQYVTDKQFAELIKLKFPTPANNQEHQCGYMTCEERMGLKYVAGYVCRRVRRDIEESSDPQKGDMTFCIYSLSGDG